MAARKPRILILGLPYFGRMLAGILRERTWEADFAAHPGRDAAGWARLLPKVARADIVYLIGSRIDRRSPQALLMLLRHKPVVVHWVGTDVQIALEEHARGNVSERISRNAVHWCDAPWLVDELATMGVTSEFVSLPVPGLPSECPPLPERFKVLLYLPVDAFDREVFDMETLLRLPWEMPDADFVLLPSPAGTLPGELPPNLQAPGWIDGLDALYREITVYVRLTSHDGTSFMVLECLARGRQVIWTFPMPGAINASGFDDVLAALRALKLRHDAGQLPLNEAGRAYTAEHFDATRLSRELSRRLRRLLPGSARE